VTTTTSTAAGAPTRVTAGALAPPLVYFGGKQTLAGRIAALLPAHEHYVEPFAGSLAVLLAKPRARLETVNDLDGDLVTFWRVLRDRPDDLARVCALTPHARAEHAAAATVLDDPTVDHTGGVDGGEDREHAGSVDDVAAVDDVERARRVWVRLTQGRSGQLRRTGWRHYQDPAGASTSMPAQLAGYAARIPPAAHRLAGVSLECRPALELVARYGRHRDVLLYCDPPYLAQTRSHASRQAARYRHDMPDDAAHTELARALDACHAAVVVSGYPHPRYDQLYPPPHWQRVDLPATTGNATPGSHARVECLWTNRPPQHDLFTHHGGRP
jgi:DNA adenine methylase